VSALAEATRENFKELIAEGTVLLDVWGPSCQPCFALMPHVENMAETIDDLTVVKLEAPKARRICMELGLMTLPSFVMFQDGEEVSRLSDPNLSADKLSAWVDQTLAEIRKDQTGKEV
jgi:thioredoxin-like negative regulator of GroEL